MCPTCPHLGPADKREKRQEQTRSLDTGWMIKASCIDPSGTSPARSDHTLTHKAVDSGDEGGKTKAVSDQPLTEARL